MASIGTVLYASCGANRSHSYIWASEGMAQIPGVFFQEASLAFFIWRWKMLSSERRKASMCTSFQAPLCVTFPEGLLANASHTAKSRVSVRGNYSRA